MEVSLLPFVSFRQPTDRRGGRGAKKKRAKMRPRTIAYEDRQKRTRTDEAPALTVNRVLPNPLVTLLNGIINDHRNFENAGPIFVQFALRLCSLVGTTDAPDPLRTQTAVTSKRTPRFGGVLERSARFARVWAVNPSFLCWLVSGFAAHEH